MKIIPYTFITVTFQLQKHIFYLHMLYYFQFKNAHSKYNKSASIRVDWGSMMLFWVNFLY